MSETLARPAAALVSRHGKRPRLGLLGVGWIGQNRMEAIARSGVADVALICDPASENLDRALAAAPGAEGSACFEDLLAAELDGVVIATPSALHADQAVAALERGLAVFCQKPLGRTAGEVRRVVAAARKGDKLLAVDLSYRFTAAMREVHRVVTSGAIGEIYAANLVFHNAYGPDKAWFYDRALAGGGCVMDLGIHLVDAALWVLGFPRAKTVTSRLYAQGEPLAPPLAVVEDYATARIDLETGASVELACSWRLPAGQDCVMAAEFYGTRGGVAFRSVNGSFYDFIAERYEGTRRILLASPPDEWPGRAAVEWVRRLSTTDRFDPANEELIQAAEILDAIYAG